MEHSSFGLKIKSIDDAGSFVGMGAIFGNVDLGNDLIEPGAFTRTLNAKRQLPLLWQHDPKTVIGSVEASETPHGLQVKGQLVLDVPEARTAYALLKAGVLKGLSIGYDTVKSVMEGPVRKLTELRLWEVSCVTFPMNQLAVISSVKSMSDADRATHLRGIDTHRKQINRSQKAIHEHLKALFDTGPDDDDCDGQDDDCDGEEMKQFVLEMQKLTVAARELA